MFLLDESGFGLSLPPIYAWCRRGEAKVVLRGWGSLGRVKVVGHLVRGREGEQLYVGLSPVPGLSGGGGGMEEAGVRGGLPAAVQPALEPCGKHLATGEGVSDALRGP
ncbi:probable transposase [Thermus thermophilus]|nr:probable transposase [Thermus thermophilus]BDB12395.1 hypothetical protein TthTMY_21340 [Thermus thermophilus]